MRLDTTVEAIHPDEHEVELAGGERLAYGTLVLATGARPRTLPLPGADLVGVHTYRTLADADAVRAALDDAHSAIVIGGSFIGAEAAASLRRRGLDVTLVELGPMLMPQLACPDLSAELAELYRGEGVELLLETQLEELTGNGKLLTGARLATAPRSRATSRSSASACSRTSSWPRRPARPSTTAWSSTSGSAPRSPTSTRSATSLVSPTRPRAACAGSSTGRTPRRQGGHLGRQLAGTRAAYDELPVFFTQLFETKLQLLGDVEPARRVRRPRLARRRPAHRVPPHGSRQLVGAVVHGQAADLVAELGQLIRERPTVDDPARLLDENLRPAEAIAG